MARANNGGWNSIKVGSEYQYKEDWFIAKVKVIEDNSDEKYYRFKLEIMPYLDYPTSLDADGKETEFEISHIKDSGFYNGMLQLYEWDKREYVTRLELDTFLKNRENPNE